VSDLLSLYQEIILDHNKTPRNFGRLAAPDRSADGDNPLCGDRIHLELALEGETLREIAFEGQGCAISTASASLMTEAVKGKTVEQALALFARVRRMLTGGGPDPEGELGKLEALAGVRAYPMRVKCATLPWHTLGAALEDRADPVTTEGG
jgi:nitrogen fixation NifU-like protein